MSRGLLIRYLFLLGMSWFTHLSIYAQPNHYIFFQSETNQPFYLRLLGTTMSSNATGYLLVPKLTDGKYEIQIGFANSDKEHQFTIQVEGKDLGFSLKRELDNSWSLFNLVDFSQLQGTVVAAQPKQAKVVEEEKEPVVEVKEPVQTAPEKKAQVKADTVVVKQAEPVISKAKVLPEVKKIYEKASAEGVDIVFVVSGAAKRDTVIIYVPALKPPGQASHQTQPAINSIPANSLSPMDKLNLIALKTHKRP